MNEVNSVQAQEVSDSTEKITTDINEVSDDASKEMPNDFKKDFFKQKQLMRDAIAEKNELAEKVKAYEEAEALKVGNHQKIIDTLKEENKSFRDREIAAEKKKQFDRFNNVLSSKAQELGFDKPDMILNFLSDDDKALLNIDAEMNVDEYGLDKAMLNVKKNWGKLFTPKSINIADGQIKTNLNKPKTKTAKEMTSAERIAMVKELMKNKQ